MINIVGPPLYKGGRGKGGVEFSKFSQKGGKGFRFSYKKEGVGKKRGYPITYLHTN